MASGVKHRQTFAKGAPLGYVGGVGRGAVGFTTRSDIGPARAAVPEVSFGQAPAGYVAGRGRGMGDLARSQGSAAGRGGGGGGEADTEDFSESNYDKDYGYGGAALFGGDTPYEEDDQEADKIYQAVEDRMDSRRKRRREGKLLEAMKKYRAERPKIQDQFADAKADLKNVSEDEWMAIPEVGDSSLKYKQKRPEKFTPVPDSLIESKRLNQMDVNTVNSLGMATPMTAGGMSSVTGLSAAREAVLSIKIDKIADSITGQTVIDPKGYLTDLNSLKINSEAQVGHAKKARMLLKSVTDTNPKHWPGWVARARLEEEDGKIVQARKIIREGCETCPDSEDVWLEAARLNTPENAKTILADAVRHLPRSVKIWLRAADLETETEKRKIVLRRALEFIPDSVKLWKTSIEMEEEEDARIMLGRAVECVPHSVDMWLALARLETYDRARQVLNMAREAIPTEPAIWITAAKLEEAQGNAEMVEPIISRGLVMLRQYQVVMDREQWLKEAELAESGGSPLTCQAIVKTTVSMGVEEEDQYRTFVDDAESCLQRGSVQTARAIFAYALTKFQRKKALWQKAADLEKQHGTPEALEQLLKKALTYCPQAEMLWLRLAKEKWLQNDIPAAQAILREANAANPESEAIYLAAVKLDWETNSFESARSTLAVAREKVSTERVWLKSAKLERALGNIGLELEMLEEAIKRYPTYAKFYMMAGQAYDEVNHDTEKARESYQRGLRACPTSIPLWRLAGLLEERLHGVTKARSMFELGRLRNPRTPELWMEAIRLERRHGNEKLTQSLMAKALQECPNSGLLWADEIMNAPRAQQSAKSKDATARCDNDPLVVVAIARIFESNRKYAKARRWYDRAVTLNPDLGDSWAYYYAFELRHGDEAQQADVMKRYLEAEPAHGEEWTSVSKQVENWSLSKELLLKKVVGKLATEKLLREKEDGMDVVKTEGQDKFEDA